MRKYQAVTNGTCKECGARYERGSWIVRLGLARFAHLECPEQAMTSTDADA